MNRVVIDSEADGLLEDATKVWCMCTINPDSGDKFTFVADEFASVFMCSGPLSMGLDYVSKFDEVICHNLIGYDLPLFKKVLGWELPAHIKRTDTLILSKLANSDRRSLKGCSSGPHSVEAWGIRFGRNKPEHEDWSQLSDAMIHRCREDTEIQLMILNAVQQEMRVAGDWDFAIWMETRFATIIQKQNMSGWTFDSESATQKVDYLTKYMDELHSQVEPYLPIVVTDEKIIKKPIIKSGAWAKFTGTWVNSVFGCEVRQDGPDHIRIGNDRYNWSIGEGDNTAQGFCRVSFPKLNIGSDTQLKPWLLSIGWKPVEWNFDKVTRKPTSPKLTEDSLGSLSIGVGPAIAQWLKCSHRLSMIKGWLKKVRVDGTVMAPSNSLGTPTGRQTHRVIVNIPRTTSYYGKEVRELWIAKPGRVIVGGDSASCQARMLCHRMRDDDFTAAVVNGSSEDGTDIHSFNSRNTGLNNRDLAKNFFYGFIFGAQAAKVGSLIGKGKKEGQAIMDEYFRRVPKLKSLIEDLKAFWSKHGYLIGMDGRAVYVRKQHELLCYDLQLGEAISMKLAAILVDEWATKEGLDFSMLVHYHDEIQYDCSTEDAPRLSELLKSAIQQAGIMMNLSVPLDGDIKIGQSWAECH